MSLRRLFSTLALASTLLGSLALPELALAQSDTATPYPGDDDRPSRPPPSRRRPPSKDSDPDRAVIEERERRREEAEDSEELSGLDDPFVGLGLELMGGLYLIDASTGAYNNAQPHYGARLVWEFGRLFSSEGARERWFVDVSAFRVSRRDGTEVVKGTLTLNNLTLAPAFVFPFGDSGVGFYLQLGGGVSYQQSLLQVSGVDYKAAALKPLFQHGIGLRAAFSLSERSGLRFVTRLEAMRFLRDYSTDYLLGLSVGLAF